MRSYRYYGYFYDNVVDNPGHIDRPPRPLSNAINNVGWRTGISIAVEIIDSVDDPQNARGRFAEPVKVLGVSADKQGGSNWLASI